MNLNTKILAITAVFVGSIAMANAALLYGQNPHLPGAVGGNGSSCFFGNLGVPTTVYDRQFVDDFNVTGAGWAVNRIVSNWVQATPGDPNPVTSMNIGFYSGTGGVVGGLVASTTAAVSRSAGPGVYFGRPEEILDATFGAVVLGPGAYFVMVQPNVNHNWFWLTSDPTTPIAGSPSQFRRGPGALGTDTTWPGTWTPTGTAGSAFVTAHDNAFQVHGSAVPEPASMAALGLGVLALIRRRRSK